MHTIEQKKKLLSMPDIKGEVTIKNWSDKPNSNAFLFKKTTYNLKSMHKYNWLESKRDGNEIFEIIGTSMVISLFPLDEMAIKIKIPLKFITINWIYYPGVSSIN